MLLTCIVAVQVCRTHPGEKGKYIKIILALLQSVSTAVVYECAVTLVSLSQAPTAIRAAANCYCQLLVSQSDNNVKLIVLDRLQVHDDPVPGHACCCDTAQSWHGIWLLRLSSAAALVEADCVKPAQRQP